MSTGAQTPRSRPSAAARPGSLVPLMFGGVLLAALLAGYLLGNDRQLLTIAIFVMPPVLIFALREFDRMVLTIVPVALLIGFSLPTGTESRLPLVMLVVAMLGGIWMLAGLTQRRTTMLRSALNAPLITFNIICILAFGWSVAFRDPFLIPYNKFVFVQLGALTAMLLSPLTTLLIANFVRTPERLWMVAGPFLIVGVVATVAFLAGLEDHMPNTRGLFSLWFVALAYAIVVAQPRLPMGVRLLLIATLAIYSYFVGFVAIAWLSGWVPPLVAILAITFFRSRVAFALLVVAVLLVVAAQWAFLYRTLIEDSLREGDFQRLTLWQLNLELLQNHPLLGTGPAGYALYYVTYHPQEARSTHNNYLDIIAQTGILGSLCWMWIVGATMREGWLVLRHTPPGSLRTLGLAACGGLVGAAAAMALGDWVLPFAYNQGIVGFRYTIFTWIFLGVLISVRQQVAPFPAREPRYANRHR